MNFNKHSALEGRHAFLGASKYSWLNYTEDKLISAYRNFQAIERGTKLHALARECINLKVRLPKDKKALNQYVNDAILFKMSTEQILYYSPNCYGTADAISFNDGFLRIHDLKTGMTPVKMDQLEIYTALFCLEYGVNPPDICIELRIYQSDNILIHNPDPDRIMDIMEKIVTFDARIEELKKEDRT